LYLVTVVSRGCN